MDNQQLISIYGYIYETQCLINNKKYIGQHCGAFNPKYLGSGTILLRAVKKYGSMNFQVRLIQYAASLSELVYLERYYIAKYNAINSDMYYNITLGGETYLGGHLSERHKKYLSEVTKKAYRDGKRIPYQLGKKLSPQHRLAISQDHADVSGKNNPNYGKKMSKEQKRKISETRISRNLSKGKNNPMFGKYGKNNPNYGRKNSPETIVKMKQNGNIGKHPVNNGVVCKMVTPEDMKKLLDSGWVRGYLKRN